MTALWLRKMVDDFWQLAGETEDFPRSLERSVAMALPIAIVKLPRLHLHGIEEWLRRQSVSCQLAIGEDRYVRGCLAAYKGQGIVFIEGADPADECRFTIAHEVAHFLIDYHLVRKRAVTSLGESVLEVLDGVRPASREERVDAAISGARLGFHLHLMERSPFGHPEDVADAAEKRADRLAVELLSPEEDVLKRMAAGGDTNVEAAVRVLVMEMGLPSKIARWYASVFIVQGSERLSFVRKLGLR